MELMSVFIELRMCGKEKKKGQENKNAFYNIDNRSGFVSNDLSAASTVAKPDKPS